MNNLYIISDHGGRKRILLKIVKAFMGKPILEYSIENAHATGLLYDVSLRKTWFWK